MEPYLGEIRTVAFSFTPRGWALCDGSLLSAARNPGLFSVLQYRYGGDGRDAFALPDLRGRIGLGAGPGPEGTSYTVGQQTGANAVVLEAAHVLQHTHKLGGTLRVASDQPADVLDPTGASLASSVLLQYSTEASSFLMAPDLLTGPCAPAGLAQPAAHENRMPFVALTHIICLAGKPPRADQVAALPTPLP